MLSPIEPICLPPKDKCQQKLFTGSLLCNPIREFPLRQINDL